ncbi:alpha/beta hydrolase [Ramlibacter sp. WS9]|nr:alpha/beta hydrolase [Ramlibacter sp. WS9]
MEVRAMTDRLRTNNVTVAGNPHAERTLVFAHGFGSNQQFWRFITPAYEKDHRLVLYDMTGCGGSDIKEFSRLRYGGLEGHAQDLIDICDVLGMRQVSVISHSISTMISALAYLQRPALFEKFVWLGATPCLCNHGAYVGGFEAAELDAIYEAISIDFFGWLRGAAPAAMKNPNRPELAAEHMQCVAAMRPDIALPLARMTFQMDLRHKMSRISLPVLLLQPTDDDFVPAEVGRYLQKHLPHAQLSLVPSEGHFPQLSHPDAMLAAMAGFL